MLTLKSNFCVRDTKHSLKEVFTKTKNQIQRIPINICLFSKIGIFPEIQSKHSSTRRAEKIISYLLKSKFQTSEWTCNLGLIT